MKAQDLKLGDVVKQLPINPSEAFSELTVTKTDGEYVTFYRHFTHLADFTYTGGVLAYVGISTFMASVNSPMDYQHITNIFRERNK